MALSARPPPLPPGHGCDFTHDFAGVCAFLHRTFAADTEDLAAFAGGDHHGDDVRFLVAQLVAHLAQGIDFDVVHQRGNHLHALDFAHFVEEVAKACRRNLGIQRFDFAGLFFEFFRHRTAFRDEVVRIGEFEFGCCLCKMASGIVQGD